MDLSSLDNILKSEPKYRQQQIWQSIWQSSISDWQMITNLPQVLREQLKLHCPLEIEARVLPSSDGQSYKATIHLADGLLVETVLLLHGDRQTVCVSSQVGCPLGCLFCATGQMGFKRNLTYWEIAQQVLFFNQWLKNNLGVDKRVTNVVFMGMGEPFLNYDEVIKSVRLLNSPDAFNIGARHISISTVGLILEINKLAQEGLQVNLAISLHASNDKLRSSLMPINNKYNIQDVLTAVDDYIAQTNRKVMFEYIMLRDINDSLQQAGE